MTRAYSPFEAFDALYGDGGELRARIERMYSEAERARARRLALALALAPLAVLAGAMLRHAARALDAVVRFVPSAAPAVGIGHRMLASLSSQLYGPAASAALLPSTAVWLTVAGLTLADSDTTVNAWASSRGGVAATLTAPAATNRPAYTPGAVPVVTFDGTDNVLSGQMAKGSAWTNVEIGWVGSRVAFGAASDTMIGYGVPNSMLLVLVDLNAASIRMVAAAAATAAGTSDPDGIVAHWSGDNDGANGNNIRRGGAVEANAGAGVFTSRADGNRVCIGGNSYSLTAFGNLTSMAAYAGPSLSSDQRTYLRALLSAATGVTC